ncbi:MAG: tripartite tricarboxylate transporter substrate binding protein, partial [Betaproteobacteria bacterium]
FLPVTLLVVLQQLLVANPALPANNLAELIALAKARPGSINYASYGSGSQPHLSGEMLKYKAGIDLVHVPYKGISLAVPAVMAGEVQLTFSGIATCLALLKSGRVKPIAIGGPRRSPLLPEVPTFSELGYPEVETHAWFGLFLPAGAPREAVTRLYQDTGKILDEPEFRQKQLIEKGYEVVGSSPEEFTAYLKRDSASRARAVRISGAREQ